MAGTFPEIRGSYRIGSCCVVRISWKFSLPRQEAPAADKEKRLEYSLAQQGPDEAPERLQVKARREKITMGFFKRPEKK